MRHARLEYHAGVGSNGAIHGAKYSFSLSIILRLFPQLPNYVLEATFIGQLKQILNHKAILILH